MESWRTVFRRGLAPQFSTEGLKILLKALLEDSEIGNIERGGGDVLVTTIFTSYHTLFSETKLCLHQIMSNAFEQV